MTPLSSIPTTAMESSLPNERLRRLNKHFPLAEFVADPHDRFVLCAIPKNGCTTLKRWFLSAVEPSTPSDREVHRRCRDRYSLALRPPREQARLLAEAPCIVFLRDPIRRLASAFADKFVRLAPTGCFEGAREVMEELARRRGTGVRFDTTAAVELAGKAVQLPSSSAVDYARGVTFREFVTLICSLPDAALDPHWRPQAAFLQPLARTQASHAPLEALSTTLNGLAKRLGLRADHVHDHPPVADTASMESPWTGDLADIASGTLAAGCADLPGAAALFDAPLLEAVQGRYSPDVALWQSVRSENPTGLPCQPS